MVLACHFNFSVLLHISKWLIFHRLPCANDPSAVTLKDEVDLFPWRKEIQTKRGWVRNTVTGTRERERERERKKRTNKLRKLNSYIFVGQIYVGQT
jgi:hypothetical protein